MQIAVEVPSDFMALREKQTVEQEMRLCFAVIQKCGNNTI